MSACNKRFNSKLVRLEEEAASGIGRSLLFQFQTGSIRSHIFKKNEKTNSVEFVSIPNWFD